MSPFLFVYFWIMKKSIAFILCFGLLSCGVTKQSTRPAYKLKFLDEYIIPANSSFNNLKIGGLSGIDFKNDTLYLIDDRSTKPIIYTLKWKSFYSKIEKLSFIESINLKETDEVFRKKSMDLESIRIGNDSNFWLSSEGNINASKNPSIFQIDTQGNFLKEMKLPNYFKVGGNNYPISNRFFEAMTWDHENKNIWAATELPLQFDGSIPQLWKTYSPVRFTEFNTATGEAKQQFTYNLDRVVRVPLLPFYVNGITEILSLSKNEFLVVERSFSAGRGKRSNRIKLFLANKSGAVNTLTREKLSKRDEIVLAKKELLLDFKKIRKQIPSKRIDNIEGLCFGPTLANGNKTLLFVSDNNFNSFGDQITQIIWIEIIDIR